MGSIKQLLPFTNSTLLEIAIENGLASKVDKVYCVLGAHSETIKSKIKNASVTFINNSNWKDGLSSSLVAGVSYLQSIKEKPEAVLVMLADQPHVVPEYINALIELHREHTNKIIVSSYENIKGVPAIFPKSYNLELLKLKGDKGAKVFLNRKDVDTITLASKNTNTLIDVDTPEDYNKLLDE